MTPQEALDLFVIGGVNAVNRQLDRLDATHRMEVLKNLESTGHWDIVWHDAQGEAHDAGIVWQYVGPDPR
jgi:hypothetical protein